MKIAFIVNCFPSLSETFILNQVVGLIERGHEVDIYTIEKEEINKVHSAVNQYNLLDRTYCLPAIPQNRWLRLIKSLKLLAKYIYKCPRAMGRSLNLFKSGTDFFWLLYAIVPNLNKTYDIIHCQFGTQSFQGMAFRRINAPGAKLITTFRGHDISSFLQQQGRDKYNDLFKIGDFFLANCEFFQRRVIDLGCDPNKIAVHRSGLDCSKFPFDFRYPPAEGKILIAATGRLVEKKGFEYAIRAVAQQAKTHPIEFNIIGDGELRPKLERLIDRLNAGDFVNLLGWKNEQEIIEILRRSHLFIAPSVTAASGNQDAPINVLKEAMAMGLPVISTYHGGIPELVEDGVSGFLVPEKDADALAEKLGYLLDHPETWPQMGRAGRTYVEQHYDLHKLNDRLVNIYQQLLTIDSGLPECVQKQVSSSYT